MCYLYLNTGIDVYCDVLYTTPKISGHFSLYICIYTYKHIFITFLLQLSSFITRI